MNDYVGPLYNHTSHHILSGAQSHTRIHGPGISGGGRLGHF